MANKSKNQEKKMQLTSELQKMYPFIRQNTKGGFTCEIINGFINKHKSGSYF